MRYANTVIINRYGIYQSSKKGRYIKEQYNKIKRRLEYSNRPEETCACKPNDGLLSDNAYAITPFKTDGNNSGNFQSDNNYLNDLIL